MSNKSAIEWLHWPGRKGVTWNPYIGCTPVSPGCENCYAKREEDGRFRHLGRCKVRGDSPGLTMPSSVRTYLAENAPPDLRDKPYFARGPVYQGDEKLREPLRWKAPRTVFVCSRSDLFHEDIPFEQIGAVYGTMAAAQDHIFIVCTKRARRMAEFYRWVESDAWPRIFPGGIPDYPVEGNAVLQFVPGPHTDSQCRVCHGFCRVVGNYTPPDWPLPNVVPMTTAENQQRADERIPKLLECPAVCRGVSIEPMLGPVRLRPCDLEGHYRPGATIAKAGYATPRRSVDWVIVGGESGKDARLMDPDWARSVRDQCRDAGVPCFVKQMTKKAPIPDDLMIRELPELAAQRQRTGSPKKDAS